MLTGDPALRFFLKALAILAVTACIFGFYLWDMRRSETSVADASAKNALRALLSIVVLLVIACLGYSMFLLGTPGEQRSLRFDEQRISDLRNICSQRRPLLGNSISSCLIALMTCRAQRYSIFSIHDPESNEEEYEYRAMIEESGYELCAVFSADSARSH